MPVSGLYYSQDGFALLSVLLLLGGGLWNATLLLSEAGFYGMSYALALLGSVAVQKNTCDVIAADSAYVVPVLPPKE